MKFADIYLFTVTLMHHKFLKTYIYDTVPLCADKCLLSSCSNRGGKVNCTLTDPLPQQPIPNHSSALKIQGAFLFYFTFII